VKILITGSVNFKNLDLVNKYIDAFDDATEILVFRVGGPSSRAYNVAKQLGIKVERRVATWDYVSVLSEVDQLLAFWDGASTATEDLIDEAFRSYVYSEVVAENGEVVATSCYPDDEHHFVLQMEARKVCLLASSSNTKSERNGYQQLRLGG